MNRLTRYLRAKNPDTIMSFTNLRLFIGVIGRALPLVCYLGGRVFAGLPLGPSISSYYYTNAGDAFVGAMIGVAMFLVTYRGYERLDDIVSSATGAMGVGIALFPCLNHAFDKVGFFNLSVGVSNVIHSASAGLFFLLLAINSIFIFTMTDDKSSMTDNKKKRNVVYVACGLVIVACLVALGVLHAFFTQDYLDGKTWVFFIETALLEAFGVSWLVKGETLFRD